MSESSSESSRQSSSEPSRDHAVVAALAEALGDRLRGVYLFGSDFSRPPQSPRERLLVLVERIDRGVLEDLDRPFREAQKAGIFLRLDTLEDLLRGADAFPVLVLELLDTYEVLHGENLFSELRVERDRLRLRVEQSLRGIHRDLVRVYLHHHRDPRTLATEMRKCIHRLFYLVRGALIVMKVDVPSPPTPRAVLEAASKLAPRPELWSALEHFAGYQTVLEPEELRALCFDILSLVDEAVQVVDRLDRR